MWRFGKIRLARMSGGRRCLIRDLGFVKGGKGLRHHELLMELSWSGIVRFAGSRIERAPHRVNRKPSRYARDGTELMVD